MNDKSDKSRPPEWSMDDHANPAFTSEVMHGVRDVAAVKKRKRARQQLSADEIAEGILAGNRTMLARGITLIESKAEAHRPVAREVLRRCQPHAGQSIRLGITGTPGAGKSTFIESLGKIITGNGSKIAVLAIDPSSSRTGGSVLGDKTRMEELSRDINAFIRPSAAGGALGGVAARTREAILLCEAAGYDHILVETVGVGQSEVSVRSMVDFFLLLQIAGGGDELQGIKRGVIEMADAIVVNKADGDNINKANLACGEYKRVLHYLNPYTQGWKPRAMTCSAKEHTGVAEVLKMVTEFCETLKAENHFETIRAEQNRQWLHTILREAILDNFYRNATKTESIKQIEQAVAEGKIPVVEAVEKLLDER